MAFEPQQYSSLEMAKKIVDDERFDFLRNIHGRPIFSYDLHTGRVKLPDGETPQIYARANIHIMRIPFKYRKFQEDEEAVRELRKILGDEQRGNLKDEWHLRLNYDHWDESRAPSLPERISVRLQTRKRLELDIERIAKQQVEVWNLTDSILEDATKRPPFTKKEDISFLTHAYKEGFEKFNRHHKSRGVKVSLPMKV